MKEINVSMNVMLSDSEYQQIERSAQKRRLKQPDWTVADEIKYTTRRAISTFIKMRGKE